MRTEHNVTRTGTFNARESGDLLVAIDVGSARVACAVAEIGRDKPVLLAAESATSYGIRGGEIVDVTRASEAIRIAILAASDRADAEVRTVVVGLSGDTRLSTSRAAMDLDRERRTVTPSDIQRLRKSVVPEAAGGRRIIHRFDGPYSVGDLQGVEHPEGLSGDKLDMQATFLSAAGDRLDNVLKAVRGAEVEVEAVSLEPFSGSIGALSRDERALGAAVIDLGAGAFRAALWEGGRLRQIHVVGREGLPAMSQSGRCIEGTNASLGGMDGVVMALARRFRIAPATAERLLKTHAALGDAELDTLSETVEVAAVDGLGSVKIETRELSRTLEELLAPVARSLREGLSGFATGHAVGVVLIGGGARIKGMPAWMSKRFGTAPVRLGVPDWRADGATIPPELADCGGCTLAGLLAFGAEERARMGYKSRTTMLARIGEGLRKFVASL
jgi:cell division protein FtsA